MLCALLRAVKIFFVGNAFFSSHAVVHIDRNLTLAAITYHLEHEPLDIDHTVTLVQDARYHTCFMDLPHTVTNRYLYLGPELKEKLRHMERIPFLVGGSRLAPCLYVNPYSSDSHEETRRQVNQEVSQPSKTPRIVVNKTDIPHNKSSPTVRPSSSIRPVPRSVIHEKDTVNTSTVSPTARRIVSNATVPQWIPSTPGRTIQPIRNHSSRPENHTRATSQSHSSIATNTSVARNASIAVRPSIAANQSFHDNYSITVHPSIAVHKSFQNNHTIHNESAHPTELIMELSRSSTQHQSDHSDSVHDRHADPRYPYRVYYVKKSDLSDESEESDEGSKEESEDAS